MFGRNLSWIWLDKPWSVHRGITHDDRIYSEPYAFKPERYLDPSKPCLDPRNLVFGTGKRYGHRILSGVVSHLSNHRSCVGRYLAENMIFIALVTLLFAFDISPEVDKNGKTIIPEVEYTGGAFMWVRNSNLINQVILSLRLCSHPDPFPCRITPRRAEIASIINQNLPAWIPLYLFLLRIISVIMLGNKESMCGVCSSSSGWHMCLNN